MSRYRNAYTARYLAKRDGADLLRRAELGLGADLIEDYSEDFSSLDDAARFIAGTKRLISWGVVFWGPNGPLNVTSDADKIVSRIERQCSRCEGSGEIQHPLYGSSYCPSPEAECPECRGSGEARQ